MTTPTSCSASAASTPGSRRRRCRSPARSASPSSLLNSSVVPGAHRGLLRRHLQHRAVRRGCEVFFGLDILNVQGHLAFDALFQFSPFYFVVEISASFSVKVFGIGLFSVGVRGSLDGPSPWHVKGHGSISLLFWDIDVDFEDHLGRIRGIRRCRPIAAHADHHRRARQDRELARDPAGRDQPARSRSATMPEAEAALVLHPVGVLHISQRALPLALKLDKLGAQKPSDVNRLSIDVPGADRWHRRATRSSSSRPRSSRTSPTPTSSPSRRSHPSGRGSTCRRPVRMPARRVMVRRVVRYEEIIIDSNYKRFARRFRRVLRRAVRVLPERGRGGQVRAVAGGEGRGCSRSPRRSTSAARRTRWPTRPTTRRLRRRRCSTARPAREEYLDEPDGGRSVAGRRDPRDPDVRDGVAMTLADRHLLVPPVAAPGPGQPDHGRRLRRRASRCGPPST